MDARRDTAVMPCGPKVDITYAADCEPERSDNFRYAVTQDLTPFGSAKLILNHVYAAICQQQTRSLRSPL